MRYRYFFCLVAAIALGLPEAALALPDDAGPAGAAQASPPRRAPDFLFGRPRGSIAFRASWLSPRAGGDLFAFVERQLTVDNSDFRGTAFSGELGLAVAARMDVLLGFEVGRAVVASEYRNFVDNHRLPIAQSTELIQANLTASLKIALTPKGRGISHYVWIPRAVTPYVGVGGGFLNYDFSQTGDFVDFVDLSVFPDKFQSGGWTPSAHVMGGADFAVWRRLFVTADARYVWAHAGLDRDFAGFDGIDLAGLRVSTGINMVF